MIIQILKKILSLDKKIYKKELYVKTKLTAIMSIFFVQRNLRPHLESLTFRIGAGFDCHFL